MSKSIWHKPSEITDTDNNLIIKDFVNRTYEIGWFDDNDMIFRNFRNSDTYDEEGMMKWCDVDDIVNDYERLQTELDRTRKALDVAVDKLKGIKSFYDDSYADPNFVNWHIVAQRLANDADDAIKAITALEQKD